jgi:hypothetical protein
MRIAPVWIARIVVLLLASATVYLWALERVTGRVHGPGAEIEGIGATLALVAWTLSIWLGRRLGSGRK